MSRCRIRSRNRTRSRSARRSARCSTPATGSSIRRRASGRRPTATGSRRSGAEGVLGHRLRFHQRRARGRQPERRRGREGAGAADRRGAAARRGHHIRLERRAASAPWRWRRSAPAATWWWSAAPSERSVDVARELGYLDGLPEFLDQETYAQLPRNKVVALMTGSQGEPRAALARIAAKDQRALPLASGDRVIFSSRTIPGNERAVNTIINALVDLGAEVITDRDALVHTSGHPRRDELRQLYDWIEAADRRAGAWRGAASSRAGEARARRRRAAGGRDPERADAAACARPRRAASIRSRTGRLYRDGRLVVPQEASGVADRRRLSFRGRGQRRDRALRRRRRAGGPDRRAARRAGERCGGRSVSQDRRRRRSTMRSTRCRSRAAATATWCARRCRRAVRGEIDTAWGKKPQTIVHVHHVSD